jgi:hypothetical protein
MHSRNDLYSKARSISPMKKYTKKNSLILSSISVMALITMIVMALLPISQEQSFGQEQEQTNNTIPASSNQSTTVTTSFSTNMTTPTTNATQAPGSVFKLSRASIPIDILLRKGYVNGNEVLYITTDASDKKIADQITNQTGFKVNFASLLAKAPDDAVAQFYVFKNGVKSNNTNTSGTFGFQPNVANAQPGDANYSPLWKINTVEWKSGVSSRELRSEKEIVDAKMKGEMTVTPTEIYVNCPFIQWKGGSMKIREDKTITDDSPYVGGQVIKIDTAKMIVTMVAHRGYGPDGKTIYYIVADATPEMPSTMMGVTNVPLDEKLASSAAAVDLFQFMNGIKGSGPMGFQAGIGAANPDDPNYSPMWKISFIEWKDPLQARVLETLDDIVASQQAGLIAITPAMEGKHIVNCPFFEPSTIFEHQSKSAS